MTRDGKATKYISFCLLTILLGFAAGGIVWVILQIMQIGIGLIWTAFPTALGLGPGVLGVLLYNLIVCFIGALFIALGQKHYGRLPDTMEEVLGRVKKTGHYPYSNLHHIAIAALFPLLFGGALGPEAGLSGLIAGLCCWIGDRLKYKGDQVAALAETGIAAALGVIFGAPFFGIVNNLEPNDATEKYREKLVSKKTRILIYCFGVAGAVLSFELLGRIFQSPGGLPRFPSQDRNPKPARSVFQRGVLSAWNPFRHPHTARRKRSSCRPADCPADTAGFQVFPEDPLSSDQCRCLPVVRLPADGSGHPSRERLCLQAQRASPLTR